VAKELKSKIEFRVHPQARRSGLAGLFGTGYKLDVSAPAVDGKANDACIQVLSELTGVQRAKIRLTKGHTSRSKVFEFGDIEIEELRRRLNQAL
jgi:uncharacterized protein YggU (UPF0235/DUF167 family)